MESLEPAKARRIYLLIADAIESGALLPGDRLPGEPSLAEQHSVSRATARRALLELANQGLIERRPGSGTFIRQRNAEPVVIADLADVFGHIEDLGSRTQVRLLSFNYVVPSASVAAALQMAPGAQAQRASRVRLHEGRPFSYAVTHVAEALGQTYSEQDLSTTPLSRLLERSGVEIDHAHQKIGAALAGPKAAELLGVDVGAALITITRITSARGVPVEHLHALYRPDRFVLTLDVERKKSTRKTSK